MKERKKEKLMWEQKAKCPMFSLLSGSSTLGTHGHKEDSNRHWGLLEQGGKGQGLKN